MFSALNFEEENELFVNKPMLFVENRIAERLGMKDGWPSCPLPLLEGVSTQRPLCGRVRQEREREREHRKVGIGEFGACKKERSLLKLLKHYSNITTLQKQDAHAMKNTSKQASNARSQGTNTSFV